MKKYIISISYLFMAIGIIVLVSFVFGDSAAILCMFAFTAGSLGTFALPKHNL